MKGLFVVDFDNTITLKDFYHVMIDDYIGDDGRRHYETWKKENKIDVSFLNKIFTWHQFSDNEHVNALNKIDIDTSVIPLIEGLQEGGWEVLILSAGFDYYIHHVLKRYQLDHFPVIANPGVFENGYFQIQADKDAWYYHPVYGVDKGKVINHYKGQYDYVYFAGDSEPDYTAAVNAHQAFGKNELADLLSKNKKDFIRFSTFKDIESSCFPSLEDV